MVNFHAFIKKSQGHILGIQQNNQSVCQAPSYPSFRYTAL